MDPMTVSHLLLWVVVLVLGVAVLALARQVGVLHERIAPMGALMMDSGPKVGELAPSFTLRRSAARRRHWAPRRRGGSARCCSSCRRPARSAASCCRC